MYKTGQLTKHYLLDHSHFHRTLLVLVAFQWTQTEIMDKCKY